MENDVTSPLGHGGLGLATITCNNLCTAKTEKGLKLLAWQSAMTSTASPNMAFDYAPILSLLMHNALNLHSALCSGDTMHKEAGQHVALTQQGLMYNARRGNRTMMGCGKFSLGIRSLSAKVFLSRFKKRMSLVDTVFRLNYSRVMFEKRYASEKKALNIGLFVED